MHRFGLAVRSPWGISSCPLVIQSSLAHPSHQSAIAHQICEGHFSATKEFKKTRPWSLRFYLFRSKARAVFVVACCLNVNGFCFIGCQNSRRPPSLFRSGLAPFPLPGYLFTFIPWFATVSLARCHRRGTSGIFRQLQSVTFGRNAVYEKTTHPKPPRKRKIQQPGIVRPKLQCMPADGTPAGCNPAAHGWLHSRGDRMSKPVHVLLIPHVSHLLGSHNQTLVCAQLMRASRNTTRAWR
ncbi:hypothetical protein B0T19DRAFT_283765 [Cercophora scortea]|uniref:Uncharacterized protein n=1 Tax=Cercophora scortea TaxID=314031 RepID=A0AAE0M6C4_9PEZI|nr:hypothetical protein B0T19DRAFT_283765 [Cercophora scortea]